MLLIHPPVFHKPQAADIVRILGIGRNEYIAVMVQVRIARHVLAAMPESESCVARDMSKDAP